MIEQLKSQIASYENIIDYYNVLLIDSREKLELLVNPLD